MYEYTCFYDFPKFYYIYLNYPEMFIFPRSNYDSSKFYDDIWYWDSKKRRYRRIVCVILPMYQLIYPILQTIIVYLLCTLQLKRNTRLYEYQYNCWPWYSLFFMIFFRKLYIKINMHDFQIPLCIFKKIITRNITATEKDTYMYIYW